MGLSRIENLVEGDGIDREAPLLESDLLVVAVLIDLAILVLTGGGSVAQMAPVKMIGTWRRTAARAGLAACSSPTSARDLVGRVL